MQMIYECKYYTFNSVTFTSRGHEIKDQHRRRSILFYLMNTYTFQKVIYGGLFSSRIHVLINIMNKQANYIHLNRIFSKYLMHITLKSLHTLLCYSICLLGLFKSKSKKKKFVQIYTIYWTTKYDHTLIQSWESTQVLRRV